jgi:hypothetical protein
VLVGNGLAVRGKVRPSGRRRVKVVLRGAEGRRRSLRTRANGTFALRWLPGRIGSYAARAYVVRDRAVTGSKSSGHGRSVTVPVIDRGPYVAGRDYDLTTAVKEKLGFPGVGT